MKVDPTVALKSRHLVAVSRSVPHSRGYFARRPHHMLHAALGPSQRYFPLPVVRKQKLIISQPSYGPLQIEFEYPSFLVAEIRDSNSPARENTRVYPK